MKRKKIIIAGGLIIVASAVLLLLFKFMPMSPRETFGSELDAKFEKLIDALQAFDSKNITKESEGDVKYNKGQQLMIGQISASMPRSFEIIQLTRDIKDHFKRVSFALLTQDISGYEKWADRLKINYNQQVGKVEKELERIKKDFINNKDSFTTIMFGPLLGLTQDGDLYFIEGKNGYLLDKILAIDLELWIKDIKEKSMKINQP